MKLSLGRSGARCLSGLSLFAVLGFCVLSGAVVLDMRRDAWDRADEAARSLNRAIRWDIGRTLEALDLSLRAVATRVRHPDTAGPEPGPRNLLLLDNAATTPRSGSLLLLDAAGEIVMGPVSVEPHRGQLADRDHFLAHRDRSDTGLHVGQAFHEQATGQWLLGVSRRLENPDGTFAGVVAGTLRMDHLRELFEGSAPGPGGRIALLRDDGTVLMRLPNQPEDIGRGLSGSAGFRSTQRTLEGRYRALSALDGVDRVHTFGRVGDLPLVVSVDLAAADIEAGWRRRAGTVGGTTLILAGILLAGILVLHRGYVARRAAELAARENEAGFRLLAENTGDMVSRIGPNDVLRYVSPAALRLLGSPPGRLEGRSFGEMVHPDERTDVEKVLAALRSGQATEATVVCRARRADGSLVWIETTLRAVADAETSMPDGAVAVSRDVSGRKAQEAELSRLARLDGLTGLANRRALDEALGREWARCAVASTTVSLLLVDVDRFKAFNDHYGHQGGDECLRVVAATVGATIRRATDLVARYGGEEFAVLLPDTDAAGAEAVAERLRAEVEALGLPHDGFGVPGAVVTVSIGTATARPAPDGVPPGPASLVGAADRALYEAKRHGRNRVEQASGPGRMLRVLAG